MIFKIIKEQPSTVLFKGVCLPFLLIAASVFALISWQFNNSEKIKSQVALAAFSTHIDELLVGNINALRRIAQRYAYKADFGWPSDADNYLADMGSLRSIGILNRDGAIKEIRPTADYGGSLGLDLTTIPNINAALVKSLQRRDIATTKIVKFRNGGHGVLVIYPLFSGDVHIGYHVAAINLDAKLLAKIPASLRENFRILFSESEEAFYDTITDASPSNSKSTFTGAISVYDTQFDITLIPRQPLDSAIFASNKNFLIGIILSGVFCYLAWVLLYFVHINRQTRMQSLLYQLQNIQKITNEHAIVSITDPAGNIVAANEKFCKISGYTESELIGKNHRIVNSGHHDKAFFVDLYKHITNGKTWSGLIKNKAKNGNYYWVGSTIQPNYDSQGNFVGFISVRTDVTDQVLEAENARQEKLAKDQFISTVSHELRTPLNAIVGFSTMLNDTPLTDAQKEYLDYIQSSSDDLMHILDQIISLQSVINYKASSGFSLQKALNQVTETLESKAQQKNLSLNIDLTTDYKIAASEDSLQKLLLNFITNAVQYSSDGQPVNISVTEKRNKIIVHIHNSGRGMSEKLIGDVSKGFARGDEANSKNKGIGLGIAIAKKQLDAIGGGFTIESDGQSFTTIHCYLPIQSTVGV